MKDGLREDKYRCSDCDKELTPDERFCAGKLEKHLLTEQDKEFQMLIEVAEEYLKQKRPARGLPQRSPSIRSMQIFSSSLRDFKLADRYT